MTAGTLRSCYPQQGFTLVEMLMVLAIIGVLASIATPRYRNAVMQARRTEAYTGLRAIYQAEQLYHAEYAEYTASFADLGLTLEGSTPVNDSTIDGMTYRFEIGTYDLDDVNSHFWATATGDLSPGDAVLDVLLMEPGASVVE